MDHLPPFEVTPYEVTRATVQRMSPDVAVVFSVAEFSEDELQTAPDRLLDSLLEDAVPGLDVVGMGVDVARCRKQRSPRRRTTKSSCRQNASAVKDVHVGVERLEITTV